MFIGSLGAITQKNVKRLLGYSSISHMGYLCAGFAAQISHSVLYTYLIVYSLMTMGVFLCLSLIQNKQARSGELEVTDLSNLSVRSPVLAATFSMLLFSMAGIPPFVGFFTKLCLFSQLMEKGFIIITILGLISAIISAGYYLRLVKAIYFDHPHDERHDLSILTLSSAQKMIVLLFGAGVILGTFLLPSLGDLF